MWSIDLRPLIWGLIILGALIVGLVWGIWELIDWLWIDNAIKTHHALTPSLEITIKDGVADTLYIYRLP